MISVIATDDIKCGGKFRHPGDQFEIEDELALELMSRGLVALADAETITIDDSATESAEEETEAKDGPMVDSAGTEFDESRHMRYVNGDRAGQPIINKDGTWRNKPGTGTV